jgi:hypothetical protein
VAHRVETRRLEVEADNLAALRHLRHRRAGLADVSDQAVIRGLLCGKNRLGRFCT